MPAILILIFFIQLFFIVFSRKKELKFRESLLAGTILFAAFVAVSTEILSLFNALNQKSVLIFWLASNLAAGFFLYFIKFSLKPVIGKINDFRQSPEIPKGLLYALAAIYALVLLIAVVSPPNTVDGLTYHLPRVGHWIQSESLAPFATSITRQLYQPPLVEFHILHLHLLAGDDRFANLVQFACFILCGVAASSIAEKLKLNIRHQFIAALLAAAVPMAIIQASSPKNDLAAALFLLLFFYFYLDLSEKLKCSSAGLAGLALGLAVLAKTTSVVFCFPVGLLIAGNVFLKPSCRKLRFLVLSAVVVVIGLSFSFGHSSRNLQAFGTPFAADPVTNQDMSAGILASNLIRNFSIHLGSLPVLDRSLENAVRGVLGAEADNPASTYFTTRFAVFYSTDEGYAGNFAHIILISIACGFFIFIYSRRKESELAAILSLSIVGGFIIFCLILQWQPFHSRLHLPLFILGCPLAAAFLERIKPSFSLNAVIISVVAAIPFILFCVQRPLISLDGRSVLTAQGERQYFLGEQRIYPAYKAAAAKIKELNASEIGLALAVDYNNYNYGDYEYLLWAMTKSDDFAGAPIFRHVGVKNETRRLNAQQTPPEWVISTNEENAIDGFEYEEIWRENPLRILRRKK